MQDQVGSRPADYLRDSLRSRRVEFDVSDGRGTAGVQKLGESPILVRAPAGQDEFVEVGAGREPLGEPSTEITHADQQQPAAHRAPLPVPVPVPVPVRPPGPP